MSEDDGPNNTRVASLKGGGPREGREIANPRDLNTTTSRLTDLCARTKPACFKKKSGSRLPPPIHPSTPTTTGEEGGTATSHTMSMSLPTHHFFFGRLSLSPHGYGLRTAAGRRPRLSRAKTGGGGVFACMLCGQRASAPPPVCIMPWAGIASFQMLASKPSRSRAAGRDADAGRRTDARPVLFFFPLRRPPYGTWDGWISRLDDRNATPADCRRCGLGSGGTCTCTCPTNGRPKVGATSGPHAR
jgi:hypothetical protein